MALWMSESNALRSLRHLAFTLQGEEKGEIATNENKKAEERSLFGPRIERRIQRRLTMMAPPQRSRSTLSAQEPN
jgi:hypothetical protein